MQLEKEVDGVPAEREVKERQESQETAGALLAFQVQAKAWQLFGPYIEMALRPKKPWWRRLLHI